MNRLILNIKNWSLNILRLEQLDLKVVLDYCLNFPVDNVIDFLTQEELNFFGIHSDSIEERNKADLTWFNPEELFTIKVDDLKSTSKNCAYLDFQLQGKVLGALNNNNVTINQ